MERVNLILLAIVIIFATADARYAEFARLKGVPLKPRVIGGQNAEDGQFPYQVSLRLKINMDHFCGASIISNRFLLTAAHCIDDHPSPELFVAVIGSVRISEGGIIVKLDKLKQHERWDANRLVNDIALLRTAKEIIFSESIQPISLPSQNLPAEGDTPVILSGWGDISNSLPSETPDILQFTELRTISLEECSERFKEYDPDFVKVIHKDILCTFNGTEAGSCSGDSGGPLVDVTNLENRTLAGIVSWGLSGCGSKYPDVSSRVHSYVDWIQKQIEEQSTA